TFQYSLSGFVGDDTAQNLALPPQIECTATASSDVGEYAIRCAESEDGNYQLVCEEGCLTVQPRHLDIVANSLSKSCLEADPELTYRTSGDGLVNGDVLTGHLERDPGEAAGQYTIRQGTLSASDNYATQFTNGTLTIASLKPVLVEAHGSEFTYGQTIGESDYSATFANPVTGEIISGTLTIEAPEFRPWAGSARHRVYFQPDEADKYTTAEAVVRFTIHPRPLHVSITPPIVNYGQDLTSVDYSMQRDDILPSDEISLFFPLLEQGTASLSVGSYPIVATVQSADRNVAHSYEVVMEETCCLTVLPSTVEVFADQLSCAPGDALPELTYSVVPNDFEDATTLADTLTGSLFCEPNLQQPGVYPITQGTLATDGNHTLLFHDGILAVRQLYDKVLVDAAQYANAQRSGTATVQLGDCQTGVASVTLQCDETLFDDLPSALNALASGGTLWLAPTDLPLFNNAVKLLKDVDIRCNQLSDATASSRLLGGISAGPNLTRLTLTNLEIENNQDAGIALDLRGASEDLALDIHGCTIAADNALLLEDFTQATFGATDLLFRDYGLRLLPTTADHTHTATLHLEDLTFTHEATSAENFWHIYSENDAIVGDDATSVYLTSCVFNGMAPSSASPEEWSNIQAHIFDESNKFLP
ncbi:MAG: hypothetical protein IKR13_03710, partial [Victivallales bacterium]|nr:hypothetical protein [Victivallales bacterium]